MAMQGPDGFASKPRPGTTKPSYNQAKPKPGGFNDPGNASFLAGQASPSRGAISPAAQKAAETAAIMARSGSTDPNDPHNWAQIARDYENQRLASAGPDLATMSTFAPEAAAAYGPTVTPYTPNLSGSGRDRGGGSSGGGSGFGPAPAVASPYATPESFSAPAAAVQPPAVVAEAPPSQVNVPGETFTSTGGTGTFGQYERQRQNRGPRSSVSMTPEMLRRAAAARMG
jgi:hypothetical protein